MTCRCNTQSPFLATPAFTSHHGPCCSVYASHRHHRQDHGSQFACIGRRRRGSTCFFLVQTLVPLSLLLAAFGLSFVQFTLTRNVLYWNWSTELVLVHLNSLQWLSINPLSAPSLLPLQLLLVLQNPNQSTCFAPSHRILLLKQHVRLLQRQNANEMLFLQTHRWNHDLLPDHCIGYWR